MYKFIQKIATELLKSPDLHQKIVVLPNKRSGIFLKKALVEAIKKTVLSPQIMTLEAFIESLSPYRQSEWLDLLFSFFQTYKELYGDKAQDFDEFIRWAPAVLNDFNEIDAYNVNAKKVFTYITEVKKIEDWQLKPDSPKMITDYLQFYASLYDLYQNLKTKLQEQNKGYTGMMSRYVAGHIEHISNQFNENQIIFAGFNALSINQMNIIKALVNNNKARIFWDADTYYLQPHFEAGKFLNEHRQNFKDFNWIFDHFNDPKQIDIIGVTGSTTQAQAVAKIIKNQTDTSAGKIDLQETAIVLNEEHLLLPMINSLPETISGVNITLGLPLKNLLISRFFELLVQLYTEKEQYGRFHLDTIISIINLPVFEQILSTKERYANELLLKKLGQFKTNLISQDLWLKTLQDSDSFIKDLILKEFSISNFMGLLLHFIDFFAREHPDELDGLALVKFEQLFIQLKDFVLQTGDIKNMRTFQYLFNRLLHQERLSFEGEPLEGLQIMGMLETRLLDFDHVIITSMNEGVIPHGRNDRSIIPFELKKHFGLPQHHEQNATMAYHFYRLLQRAKKISLIYNAAGDGFGAGEQSRFVTQIENELNPKIHQINRHILGLSTDSKVLEKEEITKTPYALQQLKAIALSGFSPSALGTYVRNPLTYYKRYILKLEDTQEVTDAIPVNIIGTIIHDAMEILYQNHIGKPLKISDSDKLLKTYEALALKLFIKKSFGEAAPIDAGIITGKNLIVFEIIKKNIRDLILLDKETIKAGNRLEIVGLEQEFKAKLPLKNKEVYIRGKVDRIDRLNGTLRIIDYKTGAVKPENISIGKPGKKDETPQLDLGPLRSNAKKEKLLQLLTYAWLYYKKGPLLTTDLPFEVGILSTRSIKQALLKANIYGSTKIDASIIKDFEEQLILLIEELFNPEIPFIESDSTY